MESTNGFPSSMPFRAKPIVPLLEESLLALPVRTRVPQDDTNDSLQQREEHLLALPVRIRAPQTPAPQPQASHPQPQEAPAALPFSNYAAGPEPRSRLPNRDGKAPTTQCFDNVHIVGHEYHHLLDCGHEVFTPTRQPCGGNCALKKRTTTKATGSKLLCPDTDCTKKLRNDLKNERALFGKGSKTPAPRKCTISGANGGSYDAYNIRVAEAKLLRVAELNKTVEPPRVIETRQRVLRSTRERSLSPDAKASTRKGFREREPLRARNLPQLQRPGGKSQLQSDGLFVVQDETDEVPVLAPARRSPPKTKAFDWNEQNFSSLAEKHAFDHSVPANIYDAMQREEGVPNNSHVYGGLSQVAKFNDEEVDGGEITGEVDVQETHCVCKQPADGLMVKCITCKHWFHPLCIEKAQSTLKVYDSDRRHVAMQADVEHFSVIAFHCAKCDDKAATKAALGARVTLNDMREQTKASTLKGTKTQGGEILKFSPEYSTKVRVETYRLWERDATHLVPGERLPRKTVRMLDEIANKKLTGERDQEEKRAEALFEKKTAAALDAKKSQHVCDGCDKGIFGYRWECRECLMYDLCRECRKDLMKTHQHQHGVSDAGEDGMDID